MRTSHHNNLTLSVYPGDPEMIRRESVMRRTAQYLKHAEMLVDRHLSPTHAHLPAQTHKQDS